jgi:hypothetical protein
MRWIANSRRQAIPARRGHGRRRERPSSARRPHDGEPRRVGRGAGGPRRVSDRGLGKLHRPGKGSSRTRPTPRPSSGSSRPSSSSPSMTARPSRAKKSAGISGSATARTGSSTSTSVRSALRVRRAVSRRSVRSHRG